MAPPLLSVDHIIKPVDAAPLLHTHYGCFITNTSCSAPVPRIGTLILMGPPFELLPSHRDDRFPRSAQKPESRSCHLYAGGRLGSKQVAPKLVLDPTKKPSFDLAFTFSTPHRWFAGTHLLDPYLPRSLAVTFPKRSLPWLFTNAALGGLKPAPASRLRGAIPSSSVQLRTLYVKVRSWRT
jgi:hypothetical protein